MSSLMASVHMDGNSLSTDIRHLDSAYRFVGSKKRRLRRAADSQEDLPRRFAMGTRGNPVQAGRR